MINIKLCHKDAKVPTQASVGSAGYDLYSCEELVIPYGGIEFVRTGISVQLANTDEHIKICSRSGLASRGIFLINAPGIVDNDYRGEIMCIIMNVNPSSEPYIVHSGDRIAQLLIEKTISTEFNVVESLDATDRGTGGFGSTGT
jgi:dUTP pyrophosphatase